MSIELERAVDVLERTPRVLGAMLGGLSEGWVRSNYGEGTFSPFDVVGHLIEADKNNWMVRLRVILRDGESLAFPAFDRYAMYEADKGRTMAALLEEFAAVRGRNLAELAALTLGAEELAKRGTHPEFGSVTASQLIAAWVVHDLGHTHQIAKAMAYQYREAVGPWVKYLTILPRE